MKRHHSFSENYMMKVNLLKKAVSSSMTKKQNSFLQTGLWWGPAQNAALKKVMVTSVKNVVPAIMPMI